MVKTYAQLYLEARETLMRHGEQPQDAGFLARNLLCHAVGQPQEVVLADRERCATDKERGTIASLVGRIIDGEPLAYVLGEWDFYGLTLHVDRNVLIPRDDTCAVTELAIQQALFLEKDPRILDLCTGSGCIGLAVATRVKDARVTLADLSRDALAVAKRNVTDLKLSGRVSCVQADALAAAPAFLGRFDLIVSNPPYVTAAEMEVLPKSVKHFEPPMALYGGEDGLNFYRSIAEHYRGSLKPGGSLCLEFGMGQGDAVCRILRENDFSILERKKDFHDVERAVLAQYSGKDR